MSSVVANLSTLFALVKAVPGLEETTGMSVGGQSTDPAIITSPLPAAWLLYAGSQPTEAVRNGMVPTKIATKQLYIVMVYLDNSKGQDNLINVQIPILKAVAKAVNGQESSDQPGFRFAYEGDKLVSVNPKRLTYEMRFGINSHL